MDSLLEAITHNGLAGDAWHRLLLAGADVDDPGMGAELFRRNPRLAAAAGRTP